MTKKKKRMKSFALNIGLQFLFLLFLLVAQVFYFKSAPIHYIAKDNKVYEAKATSDKKIELKDLETNNKKLISIEEFQQVDNYKPFVPDQTFWEKIKSVRYVVPMLIVVLLIIVGWEYLELRKSNKLYDILSKTEEE